ncbi:hypothetical protein KGF56_003249 [Candida oxycetoniae]|uniref:F-box domain-containing protein n=1 Tax=Candida oxycetoniae TaxID=497107 RepID=A0AAI9SWC0_9ASCO|nr:uncharacterized protein KGF56_003249 [Candida oxycetoniae]KAI3403982.1 hypothetical protein KGF56_003249 [Candida oxycetoniae]
MKRVRDRFEVEEFLPLAKHKVKQKSIKLIDLPEDVFDVICFYVPFEDLLNLSITNHRYRHYLKPRIFKNVKTFWWVIIRDGGFRYGFLHEHKHYIQQLHILDAYTYGEWNRDIFTAQIGLLPNLRHLKINTLNSSCWMKHRSNDYIEELSVYSNADAIDSQLKLNYFEWRNTRHILPVMMDCFALPHVEHFTKLKALKLRAREFVWLPNWPETPSLRLETLELCDCRWIWPFRVSQFNYYKTLKNLYLRYNVSSSFIRSANFRELLEFKGENLKSVTSFRVHYYVALKRNVEYVLEDRFQMAKWPELQESVIKHFLNPENLPNLRTLDLSGWNLILDRGSYDWIINQLKNSDHLQTFKLNISNKASPLEDTCAHQVDVYKAQEKFRNAIPGKSIFIDGLRSKTTTGYLTNRLNEWQRFSLLQRDYL